MKTHSTLAGLMMTAAWIIPGSAWADTCTPAVAECAANAQTVISMPVGENAEAAATAPRAQGFAISVNGATPQGDTRLIEAQRRADVALAAADIQVRYDGLDQSRRLDANVIGDQSWQAGDTVTFQSRMNYPAFVTRGEIRIIDTEARGGAKTVATLAITPGARASVTLPEGENLVFVHRVYDANGRYDETVALPLSHRDIRDLSDVETQEEGTSALARQHIPVRGGAVTVSGTGLPAGTHIRTLGEVVEADGSGAFVLQRIMPVGDHAVQVAARTVDLTRDIEVPGSEWFYVGVADVTLGWRSGDDIEGTEDYQRGRIAGYVNGRLANGTEITASVDTREEDLSDIFRNLDKRDPSSVLNRIDTDDAYLTYGDDSSIVEDAPTSGRFYLRAERDGNHITWGDGEANLEGAEFIRNTRTLYGLHGEWASQNTTSDGEARVRINAYAAQPDNLPGRDIFRGTGGSIYFLNQQDISRGSDHLTIEITDPTNGRVLDRRTLAYGTDYTINYTQGVIRLNQPLSAYAGTSGLISENPNGDNNVNLVVAYEYTPTASDLDGFAYGARAEAWVSDSVRIGVTGMIEDTGTADQKALGADLRLQHSETTWVELEVAQSDGPGFGFTRSTDGGLTTTTTAAQAGKGQAIRLEGQADLNEIGLATPGLIGAYYERRDAGFNSLDYSVSDDETLWGVFAEVEASDRTRLRFYADSYESDAGREDLEAGLELHHRLSDTRELSFGVEYLDRTNPGDATNTGTRTDLALRYTATPSDALSWYVYGQGSVERTGGLARNERFGIGGTAQLNDSWTLTGEVSEGTGGTGARALLTHSNQGNGNSTYFGYTLDPDRTLAGATLNGTDRGQFVMGGTRHISDATTIWAENTRDLFGRHKALSSAFGVDYSATEFSDWTFALEVGDISDPDGDDFDRQALTLGYAYSDDADRAARARLELRRERGMDGTTSRDADTLAFTGDYNAKFSEDARFIGTLDTVYTDRKDSTLEDARYAELSLGYAYRPVEHDRLNLLARYRYVFDEYGQVTDGTDVRGPLQHSHILSVDAEYQLNDTWSVGGKIGYRWSESADAIGENFTENNALLLVANARWHVVHNWDALLEVRMLDAQSAGTTDYGALIAGYRHINNNVKVGLGYNFGQFSDDLSDLTLDDQGAFINLIAKF
ncbi:hypothetical protein [Halocynthiibacter styelae]|uniref:Uncharacterized protein n=1 Tax=Halocynthiibacter styelae TaxID=2761955 RepID=A0A8J7ITR9_9RHOB|nr:hypothetical protein [Paenihalocynthiibacter styelae]MBI1495531.1 hypothetical protein [Paenihalocynthiibacter styelae]